MFSGNVNLTFRHKAKRGHIVFSEKCQTMRRHQSHDCPCGSYAETIWQKLRQVLQEFTEEFLHDRKRAVWFKNMRIYDVKPTVHPAQSPVICTGNRRCLETGHQSSCFLQSKLNGLLFNGTLLFRHFSEWTSNYFSAYCVSPPKHHSAVSSVNLLLAFLRRTVFYLLGKNLLLVWRTFISNIPVWLTTTSY